MNTSEGMKVNLAKSAGFCFGVKRALKIALSTVNSKEKVYMLGDIVHNEDVVKQIQKCGVKKIKKLSEGKNRILLIRAHGASPDTINKALRLGFKILDATCPMVKEIHKIVQEMEHKGYKIIVIGDKKHDEVQGIAGQLKTKAIVIDSIKAIRLKTFKKIEKACVVAQSTQNLEKVINLVGILKSHTKELKFFNTICLPTRIKQEEIKRMPKVNDVMIIIGSKTSANTKRLYEISKSYNRRTYWVRSKDEIKKNWFKNAKNVGVTAGASTPDLTTQDAIKYIRQIH
jgi:4-hydroxy-3-methylbut-2-enyl diphosphate reductase